MQIGTPAIVPTPVHIQELDQLGDEIAELSAYLDVATAHLLELIREFDARGGWNNGFMPGPGPIPFGQCRRCRSTASCPAGPRSLPRR
jgi:hypothetical protein